MAPDPEQIRAFAEGYTAAWCSMDPAAVAAHYVQAGSLAINGRAPAVGRDDITAVAASFYEVLPDIQVFFDELVVDGERIKYHWTFTSTNTGPGGIGNAVRVHGYESWTIGQDGLIAASLGSYDADEYARQLADVCREGLLTRCGRYPLNLWELHSKGPIPCSQRLLRTPHRGVFSELRPLTSQSYADGAAAPATLPPLLAETEAARQALQGRAIETALRGPKTGSKPIKAIARREDVFRGGTFAEQAPDILMVPAEGSSLAHAKSIEDADWVSGDHRLEGTIAVVGGVKLFESTAGIDRHGADAGGSDGRAHRAEGVGSDPARDRGYRSEAHEAGRERLLDRQRPDPRDVQPNRERHGGRLMDEHLRGLGYIE